MGFSHLNHAKPLIFFLSKHAHIAPAGTEGEAFSHKYFEKKRVRMIKNSLRRPQSKTRDSSLSHSTLLMEFGVCGVSSFSADRLFPSTSFPATEKSDSETEKFCAKLWLLMALEGLLLTASKKGCHEQEQAHWDHREGSCRA